MSTTDKLAEALRECLPHFEASAMRVINDWRAVDASVHEAWQQVAKAKEYRAALAAYEAEAKPAEPVAWGIGCPPFAAGNVVTAQGFTPDAEHRDDWVPLYAAPAAPAEPVPLTDEQIDAITSQQWGQGTVNAAHRAYARAIERAHGITNGDAV